ncbi:allophanate hydrolase [Nitrosomonas sp. Nm51]|uniref:allophanate hydrolase n=1 Tax=Nitrosomonas sp. Nm51 TaxID=133720 RepID=UPI0008D14EEF|nr:allophanate hydrolase [Nitrosomonas sp. Nm51]SER09342.1 allophanate hydrolase [Nitrosomonas sp. Nm51]
MHELLPLGRVSALLQCYAQGKLKPSQVVQAIHAQIINDEDHVWIHKLPLDSLLRYAHEVEAQEMASLPLYGIPFAIKDNIDLAGTPTTAACPAYSYIPEQSATVVQKLMNAGAIPIGKTNMDQFATGLNGTRSPYGVCRNAFNPDYIAGGSSSGSAVAVAKGLVCFSLGTDTAGSGRVPAAFNNLVGYKPTRGWLSMRGVVPACRSLDCISVFTFTAEDAAQLLAVAAGYDNNDIYSRQREAQKIDFGLMPHFRFGVPRVEQRQFFGNDDSERLFNAHITHLQELGGEAIDIDFSPFLEAARLLYEGPWVGERFAAIREFFKRNNEEVISPVREIITSAIRFSAADAYDGLYRLRTIKRQADRIWSDVDCLVTPTAGTIYTIQAMLQDPISLNTHLGYYTNFMNLLDYAAVAVPAGFQRDGLPFGVTLAVPAHQDNALLHFAARIQQAYSLPLGATGIQDTAQLDDKLFSELIRSDQVRLAVCGAHLSGLPLNGELTARKGKLLTCTKTSPDYRLYALSEETPSRPGMVHVNENEHGYAIDVEVWELPVGELGSFVAGIPKPLGIGTITLANGEMVHGFLCEQYAVTNAKDISQLGSWREYLNQSNG